MDNIKLLKKIKCIIDSLINELESKENEKERYILEQSIWQSMPELSVRTINALKESDITHLYEFKKFEKPIMLMYVRNMGKKSYNELIGLLKEKGLYELIWK